MTLRSLLALGALLATTQGLSVQASDAGDDASSAELQMLSSGLKYQTGQIHLRDGLATVNLTDSFRYLDPAGAETLLTRIWGNPPSEGKTLGVIVPAGFDPFDSQGFCVVLSYDQDGYVKDDDAEQINYSDLLKQMKESTREDNKERVKGGYPAVELVGWAAAPRYDRQTHKFYWAKEIKFGDGPENTLNYDLRILGRGGVLVLRAVASMAQLREIEQSTPVILGMVDFNAGNRYADYTPGVDKVATYGLAALVAGGIATKTGLLKALLVGVLAMKKFVVIGLVALAAFIRRLLARKSEPL